MKPKTIKELTFGTTPYGTSPFLEIQDVLTFHGSMGKTRVLNNTYQFLYNFYPQSNLTLEECLQKW